MDAQKIVAALDAAIMFANVSGCGAEANKLVRQLEAAKREAQKAPSTA